MHVSVSMVRIATRVVVVELVGNIDPISPDRIFYDEERTITTVFIFGRAEPHIPSGRRSFARIDQNPTIVVEGTVNESLHVLGYVYLLPSGSVGYVSCGLVARSTYIVS